MQATRVGNTNRTGVVTTPSTASHTPSTPTQPTAPTTTLSPDEIIKRDFYATYDVMTGIRIAATLGGFFGLVVILVVYKSKSKTEKALNDPYLAAVAAEAVAEAEADLQEEEELALQAALEATTSWPLNPRSERTARQSLGNMSVPTMWARSPRFSSVGGGYSNLLTPPTRPHGKSLPGSALRFHAQQSCNENDDDDAFDELDDFHFLNVNKRNFRRCSNITCSSSDSSYLERRGSAVVGLPPPPALPTSRRRSSAEKCWDFYYPIDIQVIQPTPDMSPSSSERCVVYDTVPIAATSGLVVPSRLAPLATISSCASSVLESESADQRSVGSDSVFVDDNYCDTDDEVTQFSTDSDESIIFEECRIPVRQYSWKRRSSAPVQRKKSSIKNQQRLLKNSESVNLLLNSDRPGTSRCISKSSENIQLTTRRETRSVQVLNRIEETSLKNEEPKSPFERPACPLPREYSVSETSTLVATATQLSDENTPSCSLNMPTIQLAERSPSRRINKSSSLVNIELGTSQETLF